MIFATCRKGRFINKTVPPNNWLLVVDAMFALGLTHLLRKIGGRHSGSKWQWRVSGVSISMLFHGIGRSLTLVVIWKLQDRESIDHDLKGWAGGSFLSGASSADRNPIGADVENATEVPARSAISAVTVFATPLVLGGALAE